MHLILATPSMCQTGDLSANLLRLDEMKDSEAPNELENIGLFSPPRPGTLAEREHRKWENAAPIENNPYSVENITKRLLEKQYSKMTDLSGAPNSVKVEHSAKSRICKVQPGFLYEHRNAETGKPKSSETVIYIGDKIDTKSRYGRDYYINEAKSPSGEKGQRATAVSLNTSRPTSSMSQFSTSTGSGLEPQNGGDFLIDVKSKVAQWQRNSTGISNFDFSSRNFKNGSSLPEVLNNERKNSKNEVNAKLNNRENSENSKPTIPRPTEKRKGEIRKLNLKSFGFENELSKVWKSPERKVVNKLDLKSFGFDSGLWRTQSSNHLNVSRNSGNMNIQDDRDRASGRKNVNGNFSYGMSPAQSVPNIAYENPTKFGKYEKGDVSKFILTRRSLSSQSSDDGILQSSNETLDRNSPENVSEDSPTQKNGQTLAEGAADEEVESSDVKKLVETNEETAEEKFPLQPKEKEKANHARPTTPEVHVIAAQRHCMHSITARSLSKQVREELRRVPNTKMSSPTRHLAKIDTIVEVEKSENEETIPQGKITENIRFWEKLQQQHRR